MQFSKARIQRESSIYIFGDTHGVADIEKVFLLDKSYKKNDFIIICGDFGALWSDEIDSTESALIKAFKKLPCKILFIDGNHENFNRLAKLKNVKRFGGNVGEYIKNKCYHLKRGEIYRIAGKNIFTMGGAKSIDAAYRKRDISWWEAENITAAQIKYALQNVEHFKGNIDIVITHTCPDSFLPHIYKHMGIEVQITDNNCMWLEILTQKLALKQGGEIEWFFGHWHSDFDFKIAIENELDSQKTLQIHAHLLYEEIYRVRNLG